MGIFTLIGNEFLRADELAAKLKADTDGTGRLLNAVTAMGLLTKHEDRYGNTPESKAFLVRDSQDYIGHMIKHHHHLVRAWADLPKAIETGNPVRDRSSFGEDEQRESFLMGMFNLAMNIAPDLANEIDLKGRNHLLDLGGGPGTYAIHFCLANPDLRATVYDLATTRPFALKTVERFGLSERIDFLDGDYVEKALEGSYDVAWLSHILHGEGPEDCREILRKVVSVLEPGGLVLIHDFILDDNLDGPLFPALFSLNMLINTDEGQSYSESEFASMLTTAGLQDIRRLTFSGPNESGVMAAVL
jgi:SAM-dependent methyltransferase